MGFRLFRRIRVAPGISLNLSKSGFSVSAGVRGAHVTVGPRGVRRTVGLPGTGIYYTTTSSRAKALAANASASADDRAPVDDQLLGQRQATGSGGCLLLLLCAALFFGIYLGSAGHLAPSDTASAPTPAPTVAPTPMPLTVSTDLPATVARRAREGGATPLYDDNGRRPRTWGHSVGSSGRDRSHSVWAQGGDAQRQCAFESA